MKNKTSKCRKFEMKKTMKAIENITNGKLQNQDECICKHISPQKEKKAWQRNSSKTMKKADK